MALRGPWPGPAAQANLVAHHSSARGRPRARGETLAASCAARGEGRRERAPKTRSPTRRARPAAIAEVRTTELSGECGPRPSPDLLPDERARAAGLGLRLGPSLGLTLALAAGPALRPA